MENIISKMAVVEMALKNGQVYKVEFYADGSGAMFYLHHDDNGRGTSSAYGFNIADAMQLVAGHRFTQHDIPNCF